MELNKVNKFEKYGIRILSLIVPFTWGTFLIIVGSLNLYIPSILMGLLLYAIGYSALSNNKLLNIASVLGALFIVALLIYERSLYHEMQIFDTRYMMVIYAAIYLFIYLYKQSTNRING